MSVLGVRRKSLRKRILVLGIICMLLLVIWIIPSIIISKKDSFTIEKAIKDNDKKTTTISILRYNISDLYKVFLVEEEQKNYIWKVDSNVVYSNAFTISTKIENYDESANYKIDIWVNEKLILQKDINSAEEQLQIEFEKEGKQSVQVDFYKNNETTNSEKVDIYYIEPYEEQFLDELSMNSVTTHYRAGTYEDYNKSIPILSTLGVQYTRMDFFCSYLYRSNGDYYDFSTYDKWINMLKEKAPELKLVAIIQPVYKFLGNDNKFSSEEEVNFYVETCKAVANHYPDIEYFEILNEPNHTYVTDDDLYWYRMLLEKSAKALKEINPNIKIISGTPSAGTQDSSTYLSSKTFFNKMYSDTVYSLSETFAYNVYSSILEKIETHKNQFNDFGGFLKQYITEYGVSTYNGTTEEEQAIRLVKQTNWLKKYGIDYLNIYNFWDTGTDTSSKTQNHGLLHNDYTPKLSYYAMKNYYENTNGSEYIGISNLNNRLESYVYDKDGKPKIIALAKNTGDSVTIPYEGFTASDIYGNKIENTNGTLTITNSPVYLDNISTKYFYEAISNTATKKYAEFEEKFSSEIEQVDGLQEQIDKLKDYMTSIKDNTIETQEKAVEMMSEHFAIGTTILNAFGDDNLNAEYVKISSMLDMLNDIGNSYEDLLTVSATSREAYYTATEELINTAETTINNNADLNILYPSKILDFAKELHGKSEYIIGLEEENDIKTGLIVSNSLHAYYLADWANDFANIYVNKYIKQNPVTVSYSNTDEFTNQDVTVTLNIGSDSKVTNNEGKNTYTFTKNGTFTFEYERRGQAFEKKVTITSIDKDAPTISGVVNGKIYTDSAKPVIKDDNLEKIEVLFNGTNIQFNSGNTLKDEGIYNITATDKAGNVTSIEMYIVEKGEEGYIIENGYILNVKQKTTVNNFATKFNLSSGYTIKRNNKAITNKDIIATGDILQLKNGAEYTIVVAGDINKDGKVTTYDLSTFRRYILGLREFDELESLAADINVDKQALGVKDYTRMRIEILGKY